MKPEEEYKDFFEVIGGYAQKFIELSNSLSKHLPDIEFNGPGIYELNINTEKIESIVNHNSKHGWTATKSMDLVAYIDEQLLEMKLTDLDKHFLTYYSENNWKQYNLMKTEIIENIEPRWTELIQECLDSFENDKFRLVIPTLFTIIEGEMSFVFQSHQGSYNLIQLMDKKAKNEESEMKKISLYSVVHSTEKQLFGSHFFYKERNDLINRHWVLHGRDEPKHWQKVDALRLFNVIASLQFIKNILQEKE